MFATSDWTGQTARAHHTTTVRLYEVRRERERMNNEIFWLRFAVAVMAVMS